MPRTRYQRPEVKPWIGKSGEKFWKADWYVYLECREKPKHRAKTWLQSRYTKSQAQKDCDRIVREETETARPDGSMTVSEFWETVFYPIRKGKVTENTRIAYETSWETHVKHVIGELQLQHINRHALDTVFAKMANAGLSKNTLKLARTIVMEMFEDATENNYITKNPARNLTLPNCAEPKSTRPMEVEEVQRLWDSTIDSMERLMWRVLVLAGLRIGEVLALTKSDLNPGYLVIDESALAGKASRTKNGKTRRAPIPASLQKELEEWAESTPGNLLFPGPDGEMLNRKGVLTAAMLNRARLAAKISDLTYRMCRTTFATHYEGDLKDLQETLGHSSLEMTMLAYRKPIPDRQHAAVEDLDARLTGKVVPILKKALGK